jgi:hypothetical protein
VVVNARTASLEIRGWPFVASATVCALNQYATAYDEKCLIDADTQRWVR